MQAADLAGTGGIGYASKPGKHARLTDAGAGARLVGSDTNKPGDVQQEVLRDPVEDTSGEKIQDSWKGRQRSSDRTARSRSCRRRCSASLGARVAAV
jgi:hypothetical protein